MKKLATYFVLCAFTLVALAQQPTPNLGLQIPATGSNNWYIPLNYNFGKLDQLLSGNIAVPALRITNNLNVGGTITANAFSTGGGTNFAAAVPALQFSPIFYSGAGSSSTLAGTSPFTGLLWYRSTNIPLPATSANIGNLFTGCTSGVPALRFDGTCYAPSGGGVTPVVSGSSQYSNDGHTALISGQQYNEEAFITGGGNNGVANAQALGIRNILAPYGSASTEDMLNAVTADGSHLRDERGGRVQDLYLNTDPGFNNARSEYVWCIDNQAAATPTTQDHGGCRYNLALFSESGMDLTGTPTLYLVDDIEAYMFGNGIHQARSTRMFCYTDDDCGLDYGYLHVRAAALAGASESSVLLNRQGVEDGIVGGTVTTGGANAMTIQTSLTNGGLANSANIIFPTETIASGKVVSFTAGSGRLLGFLTTTDTHAVSTGYGFITALCGNYTNANTPQPATCAFVTTGGGFGSFSSGLVAVGDWQDAECATATSVSGGNITMNLTKQHPANTPIYQGAGSCAKLIQGRGASPVWTSTDGYTPNIFTAGARTTTTWDVILPEKNGQNGQNPITMYGPIATTITSASQTGTTVTLTVASGAYFNHYSAPSGASICVTGVSTSAFNQCGITGIVATTGGTTLTYTVGASASISGTGGVINVGTVSSPTTNGLANYEVDCGSIVTKILGVDRSHQKGNGSVNLQANNCTMASSESFIQPNNPAQSFQGERIGWEASTPNPRFNGNLISEWYLQGAAFSGANYLKVASNDPISVIQGWGGNETPKTLIESDDVTIGTFLHMNTAPIGSPGGGIKGGSIISVGNFPAGGVETQYDIFDGNTNAGTLRIVLDVANSGFLFEGIGVSPYFDFGGSIAVNGDGTFAGLHGNSITTANLLSDANNPLTLGEQFNNGVCRGVHFRDNTNGWDTGGICAMDNFAGQNLLKFSVGNFTNLTEAMRLTRESSGALYATFFGGNGLDFGPANVNTPAITLFDGGAGNRYGMGINAATSGEFQSFIGASPTSDHFSWNTGGDLQATGVNELMRLYATGDLSIGTITDCGALLGIGSSCQFKVSSAGNLTTPSASVLASTVSGDLPLFDNITGHLADSGILLSSLKPQLSGTTGSIGGSPLLAGTCATGTATITGAVVGHTVGVSTSDGTAYNGLTDVSATVTATNTVTVNICAIAAVTPTALTYNVTTY